MLSVLIVNWNTCELLRACLRSIHRFSPKEDTEIIEVKQGPYAGDHDKTILEPVEAGRIRIPA